jgi:hypothetical protein
MLDAHPEIYCGPEIGILAHPAMYRDDFSLFAATLLPRLERREWEKTDALGNFAAGLCPYHLIDENKLAAYGHNLSSIKSLLRDCDSVNSFIHQLFEQPLRQQHKRIIAEKTPSNLYAFDAFLTRYPEGKVIYLVRDPRAVVASLLRRGMGLRHAIAIWLVEMAICARLDGHPRVMRVRYEDLVLETEHVILELTNFLGVSPAVEHMLQYYQHSSRAQQDGTLKELTSWRANPTQAVSRVGLDAWKIELDASVLSVMEGARVAQAPTGMEWMEGIMLVDLAKRMGYSWEPIQAAVHEVWAHLVGEHLIGVKGQALDVQYFHERYVESVPPPMSNTLVPLWDAVTQGMSQAFERESEALHESIHVRELCSHWHSEAVRLAAERDQVAAKHDQLAANHNQLAAERNQLYLQLLAATRWRRALKRIIARLLDLIRGTNGS